MLKKSTLLSVSIFVSLFMGLITPVQAHCKEGSKHWNGHLHCDKQEQEAEYAVTVEGDLFSSTPFVGRDGGGRNKPVQVNFQVVKLDLNFLFDKFEKPPGDGRGADCFNGTPVIGHNSTSIRITREKDGPEHVAYVTYHFTAYGDDGSTEIPYLFEMLDGVL